MQKNGRSYAFLLSHKTKSGVIIKRFEVSKRFLHFGSAALFSIFFITAIGLGIADSINLYNANVNAVTSQMGQIGQIATQRSETDQDQNVFNYSRPNSPADYALNSGGPEDEEEDEDGGEDSELAGRLRLIEATADPAFLPTMWAHLGKINNEFGFRRNPFGGRTYEFHSGMDIDGERGDLIVAPANGTVQKAGWTGGYGNMIEIDHGNGLTTRYGHMSRIESAAGDAVSRGQLIGYVGSTGRSTGPHLHYELRLGERPINPRHFLPPEPTDLSKIVK